MKTLLKLNEEIKRIYYWFLFSKKLTTSHALETQTKVIFSWLEFFNMKNYYNYHTLLGKG